MTGVRYTHSLDDAAARAGLTRLEDAGGDMTPLMDMIGSGMFLNVQRRFEEGRDPKGVAWKKSRRAAQQGGQTLIDSARLRDSVSYEAAPTEMTIGTNVIYAAIHQTGGTIRAKTAKGLVFSIPGFAVEGGGEQLVKVQSVTLPPRPFIGFGPEDEDSVDEAHELYLDQVLGGTAGKSGGMSGGRQMGGAA